MAENIECIMLNTVIFVFGGNNMDTVLWICACTLACIGIGAMIGDWMFARRLKPFERCWYRLIVLYDNPGQVESVLKRYLLRVTWSGFDGMVILVDTGMGEAARIVCDRMMSEMYGVFICGESEIAQTIKKLEQMTCVKTDTQNQ